MGRSIDAEVRLLGLPLDLFPMSGDRGFEWYLHTFGHSHSSLPISRFLHVLITSSHGIPYELRASSCELVTRRRNTNEPEIATMQRHLGTGLSQHIAHVDH